MAKGDETSKWWRPCELVVSRRRKLLGFGGLDEPVLIGLWTEATGNRRRMGRANA